MQPVAVLGNVVVRGKHSCRRLAQYFANLVARPDVELAFESFAVSVFAGIKSPLRTRQIAQHVIADAPGAVGEQPLAPRDCGGAIGVDEDGGDQRLVVEHLFEMGNEPFRVGRVTVQPSAQVVVNAAVGDALERDLDGVAVTGVSGCVEGMQQQVHRKTLRELVGAGGNAPQREVERAVNGVGRGGDMLFVRQAARLACRMDPLDGVNDARGVGQKRIALTAPLFMNQTQQRLEARTPIGVVFGEIGAGIDGPQVGSEEDAHRPAAVAARKQHRGRHVDLVEVGAFLAVDLDGDKIAVEGGGDFCVLERFVLHHVAPVAGRVADAEKDQLVFGARLGQRSFAPRIPIDRVFGMLQQIGAGFCRKAVGHKLRC